MRTFDTKQQLFDATQPGDGLDNLTQYYSTVTRKWYLFESEEELTSFRTLTDASVGWHDESEPVMLLNTSIVTAHGSYEYVPIPLVLAKQLIDRRGYKSAIGHEATAQILTELLDVPVAVNRIDYAQAPGGLAVVFKLKKRAPEGTILNREQIEEVGYDFGVLMRRRDRLTSQVGIDSAGLQIVLNETSIPDPFGAPADRLYV